MRKTYATDLSDEEWTCLCARLPQLPRTVRMRAHALRVAAGDNTERLKSEASFAHLCGAAPVPASSGKTVCHRLNPGGNRDANRALQVVALNRLRRDPRTRGYVTRRVSEGKSKREAMRCLKRYIARETYRAILASAARISSGCPRPIARVDAYRSVEVWPLYVRGGSPDPLAPVPA